MQPIHEYTTVCYRPKEFDDPFQKEGKSQIPGDMLPPSDSESEDDSEDESGDDSHSDSEDDSGKIAMYNPNREQNYSPDSSDEDEEDEKEEDKDDDEA